MTRGKRRFLIFLGILLLLFIILAIRERLPEGSVLVLEISGPIEEQKPPGVAGTVAGGAMTVLHQVLDAMDTAKDDARIEGLVLKISPIFSGWAKVQEIRAQVLEFRKSGKPTVCFLTSDFVMNKEYYLATACEQVWIASTATLAVTGLMGQATFYRGTLDKLRIVPDLYHTDEYKTYSNIYTERKFTREHREATEAVVRGIAGQYFDDVAQARKLERGEVESLVARGPFLDREAVEHRLVDRAAYWDDVQKFFRDRAGEWRPVELRRYLREVQAAGFEKIAVVHATGDIIAGRSDFEPFSGNYVLGSESVSADLRRARTDESVRAIILRVDSPGGSVLGSELIRREVELARKAKPVVVSMSDVAASGGYWIAMSASKVVTDPATLTGSIGVVVGKMNISGFYDLLGLSTDYVATSENATLLWPHKSFTPQQREAVLKGMREVYQSFLKGVAEGRRMDLAAVEKAAKGRVWTGAQAKELGLVDELGGYGRALDLARDLAGIPPDAKVQVVRYPEEKTLFQLLLERTEVRAPFASVAERLRQLSRGSALFEVRMPFELTIR